MTRHISPHRLIAIGALALGLPVFAGCGTDGSGDEAGDDVVKVAGAQAEAADFVAVGGTEQVTVTGADPDVELQLANGDEVVVQTGTTDEAGQLIFRRVDPGGDYFVAAGADDTLVVSDPTDVGGLDDTPDPSFYEAQTLEIGEDETGGFGYIETRDGTLLAVDVSLPGPASEGPYPTVLEYSGYDTANPDDPEPVTQVAGLLGYATVAVNMRGTGCSGGSFLFFEGAQVTDGYDAIETAAAQPWVLDNEVGMVGISYSGLAQLWVAQTNPPSLTSIAPLAPIEDTYRATLYPGGIFNTGFAKEWAEERQEQGAPAGQEYAANRIDEGDTVCEENQALRSQNPDMLQMVSENPFYNDADLGDSLAPITFADEIDVPVFLGGAWQDEQTGGHWLAMVPELTGSDQVWATAFNGTHSDPLGPSVVTRWVEFNSFYVRKEIPELSALVRSIGPSQLGPEIWGTDDFTIPNTRFDDYDDFDEALADFEAEQPVRVVFESGAGGTTAGSPEITFDATFDEWPIPETEAATWFLGEDGSLTESEPEDDDAADEYTYDATDHERTTLDLEERDDAWLVDPPYDWPNPVEGTSVNYVGDELDETLVMAGHASTDLWISSAADDVDLEVTLSEVRPDGKEVYVTAGWLRASHRALDEEASTVLKPVHTHREDDAEPVPGDEFTEARVELFPFAHVFREGSRIRITVDAPGGTRPLWKFDAVDHSEPVRIARSADAPSRVVLPVIPGLGPDAPAEFPPCPGLRGQPCRDFVEVANQPAS